MATTRYVVAATANYGEKVMSNLKSARIEADLRAKGDRQECLVTTVSTGRVSYRAEAPLYTKNLTVSPSEFEALLVEVREESAPAEAAPVAKAPAKAKAGRALRSSLGDAAVAGWELLYDKPRQGCQVARQDGKYALICTAHKTVRLVGKLVEEREVRAAGGWCPSCSA